MYEKLNRYIQRQFYANTLYGLGYQTQCYLSEYFRYQIDLWEAWYSGYNEEFHQYFYYNGRERIRVDRKHLNMAKQVAEDKASLLLNENFSINLEDEDQTDLLKEILDHNYFHSRANELVERTQATGTGAFVEYLHDGEVGINYITARNIIPIIIENKKVISCAFIDIRKNMDNLFYDVELHIRLYPARDEEEAKKRMEQGIPSDYDGYIIEHRILKETKSSELAEELSDDRHRKFYLTNTTIPFFQVIRPNISNNVCLGELNNGMGISTFANAISILESVDNAYDNLNNEIQCGRKRIIVHDDYAQIQIETNQDGENVATQAVFDKNDTTFFAMDMGEDHEPIREINMELRIDQSVQALNIQLSMLSMRTGLGNNYYKFEGGQIKTATEIISDNNPLFRNLKKEEILLGESLKELARAVMHLYNNKELDIEENRTIDSGEFDIEQEIKISFGDNIFQDTDAIRNAKLLEYQAGIIDKVQYLIEVYGFTEEMAVEMVKEMESREQPEINGDDITTEPDESENPDEPENPDDPEGEEDPEND